MHNTNGSATVSFKGVKRSSNGIPYHHALKDFVIAPEHHKNYLLDVALGNGLKQVQAFHLDTIC